MIWLSFTIIALLVSLTAYAQIPEPDWQADVGNASVKVYVIQSEEPKPGSFYDWGPTVMKDGDLYRMWWCRYSDVGDVEHTFETTMDDGESVTFKYPTRGDRIFYAESRDGYTWNLNGRGDEVSPEDYGPDSPAPIIALTPAESQWEKRHLGCPSVVKVEDTFYLYYEAPSTHHMTRNEQGDLVIGGEYHTQVFLATSKDARTWQKWPSNDDPQPIVKTPDDNLLPGKRRYGLGQPTVVYRDGRFIMHYVDSYSWWPDVMVRLESEDPTFANARPTITGLSNRLGSNRPVPEGAVSKFAQTDIAYLGDSFYLVRPVYGTDRVAILRSSCGVFWSDDKSNDPLHARRQIAIHDPRGVHMSGRIFPRFLRTPHGEIVGDETNFTIFYGSGEIADPSLWTAKCYTWDNHRADISFTKPLDADMPPSTDSE